jgi:hypothetical protein
MLMCYKHHHLIDHDGKTAHPIERLEAMKVRHEERIEMLTGFATSAKTEVVAYGKAVGVGLPIIKWEEMWKAVLADGRTPAREGAIEISMRNERTAERSAAYWESERENIGQALNAEIRPKLARGETDHISVFAIAPQPLLIFLGHLLSGMVPVSVHQKVKATEAWGWISEAAPGPVCFTVTKPVNKTGLPALVLSISGTIERSRVEECFPGQQVSVWEVSVSAPNTDALRHLRQLREFQELIRPLLDEIKTAHGHGSVLNVFPAAPVSVCVELGRQRKDTADLPLSLWDHDQATRRFRHAFTLGS